MGKRQMFEAGAIVKIWFDAERHTYGRLLAQPYIAVYDCAATTDVDDMDMITRSPLLFVLAVFDRAIVTGRWKKIGRVSSEGDGVTIPDYFMQDMFNPKKCRIIDAEGHSRSATVEECEGLERAAVWEAEHVEGRIRDYYLGRANVYAESLQLKRP